MEQVLLNIGFGNTVVADRVVAILSPNSSPMKRVKDEAKETRSLIDVTHGRKTRAIIITDSNHVILSAIQAETVSSRFEALLKEGDEKPKESAKDDKKKAK
jgi:extracellular matrix regulatory protein A